MKRMALAFVAASMLSGGGAVAAPIDDLLTFCRTDFGLPATQAASARITPVGKARGTMSGAEAYQEAVKAAAAGQDEAAIGWMLVCKSHDIVSTILITTERAYVLSRLKA